MQFGSGNNQRGYANPDCSEKTKQELSQEEAENLNQESLERTLEFWQKRTDRELTMEDARQIRESLVKFFELLMEWDEEDIGN